MRRDNKTARNSNGWLPRASVRFTPEVAYSREKAATTIWAAPWRGASLVPP